MKIINFLNDRLLSGNKIFGHIDVVENGVVYGWAYSPGLDDDEKLKVSILIDGEIVGTTYADKFRSDLLIENYGNGMHGFAYQLDLNTQTSGLIKAMTNGKYLIGELYWENSFLANLELQYYVDRSIIFDNDKIMLSGWCIGTNDIDQVSVYNGVEFVGYAQTGYDRPDLGGVFPGNEKAVRSGFIFTSTLIEGKENKFRLKFKDSNSSFKIIDVDLENVDKLPELTFNEQYKIYQIRNNVDTRKLVEIKDEILNFAYKPLISIVVPVYNVDAVWLDKCVKSVLNQAYENWELCLYDDCSTKEETINNLLKWKKIDSRIKVGFGKKNGNISLASNEAIRMAKGEFVALLDNDDEITKDALFENVKVLNLKDNVNLIYSDEDKLEMDERRTGPYFKSDFNIDLLRSNNYICHFTLIRKSVGDRVGWFEVGLEGSQDHDLILKIVDESLPSQIHHIPKILYHWRKIPGSTAAVYDDKHYAFEAGKKALENHLKRNKIKGHVAKTNRGGIYKIEREILVEEKVSIIIPFKDKVELLIEALDSIHEKTRYENVEILLIDNKSEEVKTLEYLEIASKHEKVKIHKYEKEFNYSKINNWAVKQATGKYILFLNNDIKVITKGWLTTMVKEIQREEIGAVGCRLLYPDNRIQHAGVVVGINGVAGHVFHNLPNNTIHHFSYGVPKNLSACTAACLLTKKLLFEQVNGFDEENLKIAFNDIDYCLKLRKSGFLILYTPYAELYHFESKSRGYEDTQEKLDRFKKEIKFMEEKWNLKEYNDEYYNINLSRIHSNYDLF